MEACGDHPGMNREPRSAVRSEPAQAETVRATLAELRRLVGVIAAATGETPRSILEDEFKHAPSDDFWRARLGAQS